MYHIAAALFFVAVFVGAASLFSVMIRAYRDEIVAALIGEMPRRRTARAWTKAVRVTVRPRPVSAPALGRQLQRAAF